jgi:hypothetical protein
VDTYLADGYALQNTGNVIYSHSYPRHASYAKAESESPTLSNGDLSANGENPDRKTSILQDCWGLE